MIIVTPPERIAFSKDRITWKFQDDGSGTLAPGVAANVIKITGPIASGTQLVIRWGNGDLRLRASSSPSTTGGEFPAGDGSLAHVQLLAAWFEKNYYIAEDFTVVQAAYQGAPSIFLYARKGGTAYAFAPTTFIGGEVIRYSSGSDGSRTLNNSVFVEVKVRADNTWDYVTAYKGSLQLDDSRSASIDLGEILESHLRQELPSYGMPEALKCIYSARDYYVRYAHAGGEPFSIGQVETSEKYHVIAGGHSKTGTEIKSVAGSLKGSTPSADKFLTIHDRTRYVRVDESLYLSWVNLREARTQISARANVTYEDGSSTTTNTNVINNVQPYEKIRFAVGYGQLNLMALPKRVREYSVYLADSAGQPISETIRCIVDYSHREYLRYLSHFNSFGGIEIIKTFGKASTEYRISKESAEKLLPDPFASRDAQFISWGGSLEEMVEVASGHIPHRHVGYFLDFFLSDQQFRIYNNSGYPIEVNSDEIRKGTDGDNFAALVFQFRYARTTDSIGFSDLDRLSDAIGIVPPGVQVAGQVVITTPGGGWSGTIDPYPITGSDNPVASGGVWSALQALQPLIPTGSPLQYFKGDFSLGSLATDVPAYETDPNVPDFAKSLESLSFLFGQLKTIDGAGSGLDADLWRGLAPLQVTVGGSIKWAAPITLSLSGAVTGSIGFDGSGNVTMATTVNHTHSWGSLTDRPTTAAEMLLTDVILQGGNIFGQELVIGTKDNYRVRIQVNDSAAGYFEMDGSGNPLFYLGSSTSGLQIRKESITFNSTNGQALIERVPLFGGLIMGLNMINHNGRIVISSGEIYLKTHVKDMIRIAVTGITAYDPITITHTSSAPFIVSSTYLVENLNVGLFDSQPSSYYLSRGSHTGTQLASTISNLAETILSQQLTGYVIGTNAPIETTDTLLQALGKLERRVNIALNLTEGVPGYLGMFQSDGQLTSSAVWQNPSGLVAIGHTNPLAKLDIMPEMIIRESAANYLKISSLGLLPGIEFQNITYGSNFFFRHRVGDKALSITFNVDGLVQILFMKSTGEVGMGTTSPTERLHVAGNLRVTQRIISNIVTGTAPFQIASTTLNINLNADLLDGYHAVDFSRKAENAVISGTWTFPGLLFTNASVLGSVNSGGTINIGTDANTDVVNIGHAGGTVNLYGTVNNNSSNDLEVTNKTILLNDGGASGSGFASGLLIEEAGVVTGSLLTNAARNGWELKAPGVTFKANFLFSSLLANRSYTLPDSSGTIALESWVDARLTSYAGAVHNHTASHITDWSAAISSSMATLKTTGVPEGTNLYFTNARVLAATLDTFAPGANSPVQATDTIIQAIGKLQKQIDEKSILLSGTQNILPKYGPGGTSLANSLLIDDGAGIGVGGPVVSGYRGAVYGRTMIRRSTVDPARFDFSFDDNGTYLSSRSGTDPGFYVFTRLAAGQYYSIAHTSGGNLLHILENGRIGIGITSPGEKLHVAGNVKTSGRLIIDQATGIAPFQIISTTMVDNLNVDRWHGMVPSEATVYQANKWTNSRTLTVGGAVTGSVEIDGSGDVSLTVTPNFTVNPLITITGDATGSGQGSISIALVDRVAPGTYTKVGVNQKGLVISGASLSAGDIPQLAPSKITGFVAAVRDTLLTGLAVPSSPTLLAAGHTVLQGLGALQSQINSFSAGTPYYVPRSGVDGYFTDGTIRDFGGRVLIGAGTETGVWMLYVEGTIITKASFVSTAPEGVEPISVISTTMCNNLNAHMLGGFQAAHFLNASNIQWGVLSPSVLANTGVNAGVYTKIQVDSKGRVMAGDVIAFADILPVLPDYIRHDSRHPRFYRFSRVFVDVGVSINPPLTFDLATRISSHHTPQSLTVKFIAKNVFSKGIDVANSGLVITLSGVPEFTFDSDEIAVVVEDQEGNQTIVPIDLSVISSGSSTPACPVGYPAIVTIVEASTTGIRPEIQYSSIQTLRWRVKSGSVVQAQGSLNTGDIPAPTNKPWIPFPNPLPAGPYTFELEGQSCASSVATKTFNITVEQSSYNIQLKYYDVTSGSPVYVGDIVPGTSLPWKEKYNIQAVITGLHNQVGMQLTAGSTNLFGWGPENIAAGGASVNSSSPWLFGPSGHSEGRQSGPAVISCSARLQGSQVASVSVSFTLAADSPPEHTSFYFGRIVTAGGNVSLADQVELFNNMTRVLPTAPEKWGLRNYFTTGPAFNRYVVYMQVLVQGEWQYLKTASAPSHDPYLTQESVALATSFDKVIYLDSQPLINLSTGLIHNIQQPGTYKVWTTFFNGESLAGAPEVILTLVSNNNPNGLLENPGVESVLVSGKLYETISDPQAYLETLPDGKVKLHAPATRSSFDGVRTCNRFITGANDSQTLEPADEAALVGAGLALPPGLHTFWVHYYAAASMQQVYDNPWLYAIEENSESVGYCNSVYRLEISIL